MADSDLWSLDPDWVHLNHGSFGACPRPVLAEQARLRDRLEANPTRWFDLEHPAAVAQARTELADFVGSPVAALAFVENATTGVNTALTTVARRLAPGDQVLVTDQTYAACRNAVDAIAARHGLVVVVAQVPEKLAGPGDVLDVVLGAVGPRTRVALLDHVTSANAVVHPIAELVAALEPAVTVIVDGAHAPGMLELAVEALGASFYTGNCHKWLCAPKGAAFLCVSDAWREDVTPLTISHGWGERLAAGTSRFHAQFDWPGTTDPTAWLSVPAALRTVGGLRAGGWAEVRSWCHELVMTGAQVVGEAFGTEPLVPAEMIGSMVVVPLSGEAGRLRPAELTARARGHRIEAKFHTSQDRAGRPVSGLRLSAHLYNTVRDYERAAAVLSLSPPG